SGPCPVTAVASALHRGGAGVNTRFSRVDVGAGSVLPLWTGVMGQGPDDSSPLSLIRGRRPRRANQLSLLIAARTEELRALRWTDVDLDGRPDVTPPVPPSISVVRSVRVGGDTKTRRSRRRLAMPRRCVTALRRQREQLGEPAGDGLVFASTAGTALDAHNVRRSFRRVVDAAGLDPAAWTPREMRHSFVSLLSDSGLPIEHISRLVGHSGTAITETVYRQQLRPVLEEGATAMDSIFPTEDRLDTQIVTHGTRDDRQRVDQKRSTSAFRRRDDRI
ncbi:MAG TPA: site-specific integrase, partial [Actinophytocola sp.]|nr:site-specific integrase [Actinophytocola sp.]